MEHHVHIIEDFLTPEECKYFYDIVLEYAEDDPRDNFLSVGMINKEMLANDYYPHQKDPEKKLLNIVNKVKEYYESTYEMHGKFGFDRAFGHVMQDGAHLVPHRDSEPNEEGIYDGKRRSHVCSILLTDDYEGGDLVFPEKEITLKPKPGSLVLFPGYYVTHSVTEVTRGPRVNFIFFFYDVLP